MRISGRIAQAGRNRLYIKEEVTSYHAIPCDSLLYAYIDIHTYAYAHLVLRCSVSGCVFQVESLRLDEIELNGRALVGPTKGVEDLMLKKWNVQIPEGYAFHPPPVPVGAQVLDHFC